MATAGLAGLAVAASAALWSASEHEIDTRPVAARAVSAGAVNVADKPAVLSTLKPLSAFDETLARPVFEPSRRPRPKPEVNVAATEDNAPDAVPVSAEGLRFVGLMKTAKGEPRALLRSADQPQGAWVGKGGEISGWTVREVGERQVVLEAQSKRVEIKLYAAEATAARATR